MFDSLLDTGASGNFVDKKVAESLGLKPQGGTSVVSMASGKLNAPILGQISGNLEIQGRNYFDVTLGVVPDLCSDIVLGQSFMNKHKEITFKLNGTQEGLVIQNPVRCGVATSNVKSPRLFNNLDPNVKPIATKSRRFNEADQFFIKEEVRQLLAEGIIKPSYSPWRAQVLVTKDERHKRRMVVDYSQTVNRYTLLDAYPLPNIDEQVAKIAKCSVFSTLDLKSAYYQVPLSVEDRPYTAFEAEGKLYQYTRLPFGVTNGVSFFQRIIDNIIAKYNLLDTYAYLDNITVCGKTMKDHEHNLKALFSAAKSENLTFNNSKCVFARSQIDLLGYRISHNLIQPDPERLRPLLELPLPQKKTELQRVIGMFSYYAKWVPEFSTKIRPLVLANITSSFPLSSEAANAFETLRSQLTSACLASIREGIPLTVECDASEHSLGATLSHNGSPVAFHSRTFTATEKRYSVIEKEAAAIMDAVRKWNHLLHGHRFTLVTDQRAVSFMLDPKRLGKIKNTKLQLWRAELGNFDYQIEHRPGKLNVVGDALSRVPSIASFYLDLAKIHQQLGHPGVSRLSHFVRSKNLPFSTEDIKKGCQACKTCAELKLKFFSKAPEQLIKALHPWDRVSIDFKGPLEGRNKYILFAIDEYSRFPFAFPCRDMTTSTVIKCLSNLFCLFGLPSYVHSDRGSAFLSSELKKYLTERGIATSKSTPYHPTGNSQCERINQTVWKTVQLILKTKQLPNSSWEAVLPEALHAVRSLLCTATNATPHERFLFFPRRSMIGKSLPCWLIQPGPVLLRRFVRNKNEPLVDEVELMEANPNFAHIRFPDGRESTVSVTDLAPCPSKTTTFPES